MKQNPEFGRRVSAMAENEWREPVAVAYLDEVEPEFRVPGRRKDGTIEGDRVVARGFWNVLRGTLLGATSVVMSVAGGGVANAFGMSGTLTGSENCQAIGFIEAAKRGGGPWLVHSSSHVAIVQGGKPYLGKPEDNPPPTFVWHAEKPDMPVVHGRKGLIVWPDGSEFRSGAKFQEMRFRPRF